MCRSPSSTAPPCSSGSSSSRSARSAGRSSSPPSFERSEDSAAPPTAPSSAADDPSIDLQRDVAGEAVGDDHVGLAGADREALDVADEVQARRVAASTRVRRDDDLRALGRLRAVGQQRHARGRHAGHGLHERRAHVRELDEMLRADLDVRARVEQQERLARDGDR